MNKHGADACLRFIQKGIIVGKSVDLEVALTVTDLYGR